MSLNVSYTSNIGKGIDSAALREVTQEIFKRAESRASDLSSLDLTKFKRVDMGMDLYNGKVDSAVARQVAMTNSGMQVILSEKAVETLRFLNSEAAKSILKSVEGKMTPAVNEESAKVKNAFQLPSFTQLVKTTDLGQDRRGSNPFYKGELLKVEKKEKEENLNIFA